MPAAVVAAVVMVTVTGAPEVMVADDSLTVVPEGAPLAVRFTVELKPPVADSVSVTLPELPAPTVTLDALGASENPEPLVSFQWFTSTVASTEPRPVARS